jgi:hypothetical protein
VRPPKNRAATLAAAATLTLTSGLTLTAVTAGPAAATQTPATSSCNPKTDYGYVASGGKLEWSNLCGTGVWGLPFKVKEVRDATFPFIGSGSSGSVTGMRSPGAPGDRTIIRSRHGCTRTKVTYR